MIHICTSNSKNTFDYANFDLVLVPIRHQYTFKALLLWSRLTRPFPTVHSISPRHIPRHTQQIPKRSSSNQFKQPPFRRLPEGFAPRSRNYTAYESHTAPVIDFLLALILQQSPAPVFPFYVRFAGHVERETGDHESRADECAIACWCQDGCCEWSFLDQRAYCARC